MLKLFKNCNIIYFKNIEIFNELIQNENIFKGKIVISDFQELKRICYIHGIIHILNTNNSLIPNEKIDCIVTNNIRNTNLESSIIARGLAIPILYTSDDKQQVWCGICNKIYTNENDHPINKYCSEKCMKKDNGFITDTNGGIKSELVRDLGFNDIVSKIVASEKEQVVLEFDKSLSDRRTVSNVKKSSDKFQSSMIKDAKRLEFRVKSDNYKKEMKQPSLRKASLSDKKESKKVSEVQVKLCKGVTKKGKPCTNSALKGSNYCGIISHNTELRDSD